MRAASLKSTPSAYDGFSPVVNARAGFVATLWAALHILFAPLAVSGEAAPVRIIALGDSLTAGYGVTQPAAFPVRLEAALRAKGHNTRVTNAGVSGDTTAGGLARIDWALAMGADAVIVELGANDGMRGLDPKNTRANLDALISKITNKGLPVLLTGMRAPPNLGRDYGAEFNALFADLAVRHGVLFYPFFLEGVAAKPNLNQPDGIHPTAQGVDVIVARILPHVVELVRRARAERTQTQGD